MYSQKPIPSPFHGAPKKPQPVREKPPAAPIEATEKTTKPSASRQNSISPLEAMLFLHFFSTQKKDDSAGSP